MAWPTGRVRHPLTASHLMMDASDFVEVKIENVTLFNYNFIVLLRHGEEEHVLPICIGPAEAHSIAAAFNNQKFPRPLTHDLMKTILGELDCPLLKIQVTDMRDGTFYARLFLSKQGRILEVDSRPSDALALAVRYEAPIFVRADILREHAVTLAQATARGEALASRGEQSKASAKLSPRERLKLDLDRAVKAEDYEAAAALRDQLRKLESSS
jgi:uncharacterized protein